VDQNLYKKEEEIDMGPSITVLLVASLGCLFIMNELPKGMQVPFGIGLVVVVIGLAFFCRFFKVSISRN
jgi:hypothetical protein